MLHWQDQSDDAQLAGYRVLRAAPHSIFDGPPGTDAFAPISGLIRLDMPKFTDSSCPGSCGYRIVSLDVSGRQSRLSQFVDCDVGPDPDDVDCNRFCNDVPEALEQIDASTTDRAEPGGLEQWTSGTRPDRGEFVR